MQEKNKKYNEKEQQIAENRSRNTLLRDVRIYRNMNLMQVSVGSMMLSGMARQTEYSLFFRSHRMEPRESCPEMN